MSAVQGYLQGLEEQDRVCPACGKPFKWTPTAQYAFRMNTRHGADPDRDPCCGHSCANKLAKNRQFARNRKEEKLF